jgi:hypothetical protein
MLYIDKFERCAKFGGNAIMVATKVPTDLEGRTY